MRQAFVDESGASDHSPVFVMGGFIAPAEKWRRFSVEWQRMLDMRCPIAYFKMNEAATLTGQFLHWSETRRDERVAIAYGIIEEHVELQLSCVIEMRHFRRLMRRIPREISGHKPYLTALSSLITGITHHQKKFGISEGIDFIFDEQVMDQELIRSGWDLVKELFEPEVRSLLGRMPDFKDDQEALPLQAADMLAWCVRSMATETITGELARYRFRWKSNRQIPGIQQHYDEARLKRAIESANRNLGFSFA